MRRILGNELGGAEQTSTGLRLGTVVAPAVGLQRRSAIRAHDLEVLEPVVVRYAVDVIEDQRHRPSEPLLSLPAQFALPALQALAEQSPLQISAVVVRVRHENLVEGPRLARDRLRLVQFGSKCPVSIPWRSIRFLSVLKFPPAARRPSVLRASVRLRADATASRTCCSV